MKLQSRKKIAHDRCVSPAETIARLEALIRPRHDYWLHEETLSEHLHWTAMFIEGLDFRSMGKGITPAFSTAGALAEGAEWLTARATGELPGYIGAREHELPDALPIASLLSHVATATPPVLDRIRALDDAYHWVDGYSLIQERKVKVPLEYVRLIGGPNGKATGNNIEEAIIHATHEIFERRAHITVLRNRMVVPTIDPATVTHPVVRHQMEFLRARGIEVVLKDLSFGGVLPCLGAYFVDHTIPEDFQFRHFFKQPHDQLLKPGILRLGCGAHRRNVENGMTRRADFRRQIPSVAVQRRHGSVYGYVCIRHHSPNHFDRHFALERILYQDSLALRHADAARPLTHLRARL